MKVVVIWMFVWIYRVELLCLFFEDVEDMEFVVVVDVEIGSEGFIVGVNVEFCEVVLDVWIDVCDGCEFDFVGGYDGCCFMMMVLFFFDNFKEMKVCFC